MYIIELYDVTFESNFRFKQAGTSAIDRNILNQHCTRHDRLF